MFYVYSDYMGEGETTETEEEAMAIAERIIKDDMYNSGNNGEEETVEIYKRYKTVTVKTEITFNVTKEEDNDAS